MPVRNRPPPPPRGTPSSQNQKRGASEKKLSTDVEAMDGAAGDGQAINTLIPSKGSVVRDGPSSPDASSKMALNPTPIGKESKADVRARYWAFLFENLRRAVDEIYNTCETDESVVECKEVVLVLENCTKEFTALVDWINLKQDYENTPAPNRPTSLAWEVRKSSPTKSPAVRALNFDKCINSVPTRIEMKTVSVSVQTEQSSVPSDPGVVPKTLVMSPKSAAKVTTRPTSGVWLGGTQVFKGSTRGGRQTSAPLEPNLPRGQRGGRGGGFNNRQRFFTPLVSPALRASAPNSFNSHQNKPIISTYHASQAAALMKGRSVGEDHTGGSTSSLSSTSSSGKSWADKVKGPIAEPKPLPPPTASEQDDSEGWETVHHGKSKSRLSPPKRTIDSCLSVRSSKQGGVVSARSLPSLHSQENGCDQRIDSLVARKSVGDASGLVKGRNERAKSFPSIRENENLPVARDSLPEEGQNEEESASGVLSPAFIEDNVFPVAQTVDSQSNATASTAQTVMPDLQVVVVQDLDSVPSENCPHNNQDHLDDVNVIEPTVTQANADNIASKEGIVNTGAVTPLDSADASLCLNEAPVNADQNSSSPFEIPDESCDVRSDEDDGLSSPFDDDLESAIMEEESLKKQLEEAQKAEEDDPNWHELHQETEERLGQQLAAMSWGDRMDEIEADLRLPGHALHMHEKLSSPSRKRSLSESIRRHEEKQAKAQEQRERLLEEKAQRLRDLSKKVEEVRLWKDELLMRRRTVMERKLQRAEEKRRHQLQLIVRKAHDEEEKVNEIAFINTLEAQNKRHDVMSRIQGHEARLQDIQEERQRKQEEKAAKEAAAEERRRTLEAERQARLQEMQQKRRQKEHKIEQQQQEKEKERQEQAREKARDREERLSALHAAQQATVEELQKKIQQKQEESARRHEENMEQIRRRALELSILRSSSSSDDAPGPTPYDTTKLCTLCNVLIGSEVYLLSHLRGKKHQQAVREQNADQEPSREELEMYNLRHIIDAPADKIDPQIAIDKERQKALKKRCKKLRQRMAARGADFERLQAAKLPNIDAPIKPKVVKFVKEVQKFFQQHSSGPWPRNWITTLDRSLGDLARTLGKKVPADQTAFRVYGGFAALGQVLMAAAAGGSDESSCVVPSRSVASACQVFQLACAGCPENCRFVLLSNRLGSVVDLLVLRLNSCMDAEASALLDALAAALRGLGAQEAAALHDLVSYVVSVGVVDKVAQLLLTSVRGPLPGQLVVRAMALVTALATLLASRAKDPFGGSRQDPTQLVAALRVTGFAGACVSLLYSLLLHGGAPTRGETPPPPLSPGTRDVTCAALTLLNHVALLDVHALQAVLGDDAHALEFRHVAGYLLWHSSHWPAPALLHELVLLVGLFAADNADNQAVIGAGEAPSVLQRLCALPAPYLSDARLAAVLLPTLLAATHAHPRNRALLAQDLSPSVLAAFVQERLAEGEEKGEDLECGDNSSEDECRWRWQLKYRFPGDQWGQACRFFGP